METNGDVIIYSLLIINGIYEKLLDHWVRCFFPSYGSFIGNPSPFSYGGSPVVTMVVSMLSHGLSYPAAQRTTKIWFICHVSPI